LQLRVDLRGNISTEHCGAHAYFVGCEKLVKTPGKCALFDCRLEYDYNKHEFYRCKKCKTSETGGDPVAADG
jgi:hypothetical protein